MSVVSMEQLLEAGVRLGHQMERWNPKMVPYTYTERNGIHIIDLQKTVGMMDDAYKTTMDIAAVGDTILFVGTKRQTQDAIKEETECCDQFYVNERRFGDMLANFKTIQSRIKRLRQIEEVSQDGTFDRLPGEEVTELKEELEKLEKNLGDIKDMRKIPDVIVIIDPKKEHICVMEAYKLNIPLISIADTNSDPEKLTYVIPGNDDAIRTMGLTIPKLANAIVGAHQGEENHSEEAAEDDDTAAGAIKAAVEANAR